MTARSTSPTRSPVSPGPPQRSRILPALTGQPRELTGQAGTLERRRMTPMVRPVAYPQSIEPLVQFVEETAPADIVARTNDKLAAGTPVRDMLLASALAVVRSSDLPPGHHGGPLHPLAGLHAVRNISARLPGEYARMPVIQNVAVANKHIHSPAMGPYILADAQPVSERDSVEATVASFRQAAARGVYNACDHYVLYLLEHLSPIEVLGHLLEVAI